MFWFRQRDKIHRVALNHVHFYGVSEDLVCLYLIILEAFNLQMRGLTPSSLDGIRF